MLVVYTNLFIEKDPELEPVRPDGTRFSPVSHAEQPLMKFAPCHYFSREVLIYSPIFARFSPV
jgi:hypothetical protein